MTFLQKAIPSSGFKEPDEGSKDASTFSLPRPILPTRSMWQFWASETLQKRLSNASMALQKRSTSGLHVLLDVCIHCGRFHGQGARRCGALLARVRVRLAGACATANPGFTPLY